MKPLAGYEGYNCRNWDGYDAEPISPETLAYARKLLEIMPDTLGWPDIAPGGDGSIGFEWEPAGTAKKLCFDVDPDLKWRAYWCASDGIFSRTNGEGEGDQTEAELKKLFAQFAPTER